MTQIGGPDHQFQSTRWSVVRQAIDPASPEAQEALETLICSYWKPVYFFVRRRGHDAERAKDLKQPGALIHGIAQGSTDDQEQMTSFYRKEIARLPEMELVADQIYSMSGLGPKDVDAAVIYDAFTSIILFQLEAFGFCDVGEAKDFVKDGALEVGGRLPSNTHGGQLSKAYIHGINGVNEGVRLIRGTSVNQPEKNDCVLVTAGVGVPTSAMILGKLD